MRVRWGKNNDDTPSATPGDRWPIDGAQHSLAQALLDEGAITEDALQKAFEVRDEVGGFLGQILIDTSSISEDSLTAFLAKYCRIPHLSLLDYLLDEKVVGLLPQDLCTRFRILPIDKLGPNLTVAMVNPLDRGALDAVRAACPDLKIKPVLCAHSHYVSAAERLFGKAAVGAADDDGNEAKLEDFGFAPVDDEGTDLADVVDGEAVVTEIMSGSDLDDDPAFDESAEYRVVGLVPSGEILGATAWVSDEARGVTAIALENTSLITLSKDVFDNLLSKENAVRLLMNIVLILTSRIDDLRKG